MDNYKKTLKDGIYALRIMSVKKKMRNNEQLFSIEGEVLVDLNDYYIYRENCIIDLSISKKENLYSIKKFYAVTSPVKNFEAMYETPTKKAAAYDCIVGLEVIGKSYIWHNINEYRYTHQFDEDVTPIPF